MKALFNCIIAFALGYIAMSIFLIAWPFLVCFVIGSYYLSPWRSARKAHIKQLPLK